MLNQTVSRLESYLESSDYKCWDPFDGLNSKVLRPIISFGIPIVNVLIVQFFKRSPLNMRGVFRVPRVYNFKGIALILKSYVNQIEIHSDCPSNKAKYLSKAESLAELILANNHNNSGDYYAWGYGHHWEARGGLNFPKNAPNIVVTAFCVNALLDLYEINNDSRLLNAAISSKQYILKDLKRTDSANGFLFSYSHLNGNATVYNASALACQLLLRINFHQHDQESLLLAMRGLDTICAKQNEHGGWRYGDADFQSWEDSFHTGFILESLGWYKKVTGDDRYNIYIQKGLNYYLRTFFSEEGFPKYYHNKSYPVDCHCIAQLPITISLLKEFEYKSEKLNNVILWGLQNMRRKDGLFKYKKYRFFNNNIVYNRWSQAWMYYALTTHILNENYNGNKVN